ncbi:myelin protein zero-like protein 2 isoform X2 [Rhineura floridana]|uniref:myelin protein zero-like protein 2 isoform X2 n=1 Tax=Rhineura floridana TaxID=261503 RepID=UPI002AC8255C|nr:myelin protein zero-like protein 2 isoform X2 [Rhineura floridana]
MQEPSTGAPLHHAAATEFMCVLCKPDIRTQHFSSGTPLLCPVAAVEIYTSGTLEALNGTDVRLKCTFRSHSPVGQRLTVSWHFQPQAKGPTEFVFYYSEQGYPPVTGRFSGRVTWDGNTAKNDASIMLWNVSPNDNGTFQCHVKNPPDVDGVTGEIQLQVVLKVNFSEIHILAITIGAACVLMIVTVLVVVFCRHQRKMQQDTKMEMEETELPEKEKLKGAQEDTETHLWEDGA